MRIRWIAVCVVLLAVSSAWGRTPVDRAGTVVIDPKRGVDDRVDYESLVRIGPWDDRNYELTLEDLEILGPNEAEMESQIPAFFRVFLRKAMPALNESTAVRYPLSAWNEFRQNRGGYRIDGVYYDSSIRDGDRYYVVLENPQPPRPAEPAGSAIGEVRVTSPSSAAESAIAINPVDPSKVVAGSNGPFGGQRMHYSSNGGASWTQVNLPQGGSCCDPTVEWSSDGQFAYTAALGGCSGGCGLWFYRSDNGGATWNGLETVTPGDPRREIDSGSDREFLHVDHSPDSPYRDNIYLTYHKANVMQFARSTDFGDSWETQTFSGPNEQRGIAGDIVTDKTGRIYYLWPSFVSRKIWTRQSTNGGASFSGAREVTTTRAAFTFPIPAEDQRQAALYLAVAADLSDGPFANSIYMAWADTTGSESSTPADNHARVQLAYSRDGSSWTITNPHETDDELLVDRWQPFIDVGDDGTVHAIYYDTRRSPGRTAADVFYSFSMDGGVSWSTPSRVTSEQSPNINNSFEFGDYSGMDIVMNDLIAIFTDNRNESGGSADSVDVYAAGISPGTAAPGRIPGSRNVPGIPLTVERSGSDLLLEWDTACGGAGNYAIYRGAIGDPASMVQLQCSTGGQTNATITPTAGNWFYVVVATSGGAEGSYGLNSDDEERAPAAAPCLPQMVGPCP